MANVAEIHEYCRANDRTLCIMVNPMRENWQEMPDFIRWCNELAAAAFPPPVSDMEQRNDGIYRQLVHQVATWRDEAGQMGTSPTSTPVVLRAKG